MEKINACVLGYGNEPSGAICDKVVSEMVRSYNDLVSKYGKVDERKYALGQLEDALDISKKEYSANYLNKLVYYSGSSDDFQNDCKKHYASLIRLAESTEVLNHIRQITENIIVSMGFKPLGKQVDDWKVYEYEGVCVGFPIVLATDVYWFWRVKGGRHQHKIKVFMIENGKPNFEGWHAKLTSGGIKKACADAIAMVNSLKSRGALKTSSIKIAYAKKELLEFLKMMISTNDKWAIRALERIYQGQEADEIDDKETKHLNNIGFSGYDAPTLTSIYKSYKEHNNHMTPKMLDLVKKLMKKYAGQIFRSSYFDMDKMNKIYEQWLAQNKKASRIARRVVFSLVKG